MAELKNKAGKFIAPHGVAVIGQSNGPEPLVLEGVDGLGRYGGTMKVGGAALDAPFCHVYRFRDGKVVTFQQYTDTAQWARLMK